MTTPYRPPILRLPRPARQRGYVLVVVAVLMAVVAIVAAAVLAASMGESRVSGSTSREFQARAATEGILDLAAWQIKENIRRLPGSILLGTDPDNPNRTALELTEPELRQVLVDGNQPWVGVHGFPTTRGSGQVFIGAERMAMSGGLDDLNVLSNLAGPSDLRLLEFLSDEEYVQRRLDYNYHPGEEREQINLFAHGQVTQGQSDVRISTLRKTYEQEQQFYGSRERTRDDFSIPTVRPPSIESPRDLTPAATHIPYPEDMDRFWSVSYNRDPARPGRRIRRIGLLFDGGELGLEDPGDRLDFSNWIAGQYQPPFQSIAGPTVDGASYLIEDPLVNTTTMRIRMVTDNSVGTGTVEQQYGFKLSGIKYYFDEEVMKAWFETPHPYNGIETGAATSFLQTVWSPFNLTEDEAGRLVLPGGTDRPDVIDPSIITDPRGQDPRNIIQAMRLEFSADSFLAPGDALQVLNTNTGQLLATYTGAFPFQLTPFATRVRADQGLGIQLRLIVDGAGDPTAWGYLVSAVEYVNGDGQLVREELPEQRTAHYDNLGGLNLAAGVSSWGTTIFQPRPPGGGVLTEWSVHFNRATDLLAISPTDGDRITVEFLSALGPIGTGSIYVSPDGLYGPLIGGLGFEDIADLSNRTLTLNPSVIAVRITPEFDKQGAWSPALSNYGFWVDSIAYKATNASDEDRAPASIAALQSWGATGAYTNWGTGINRQGEWWVSVPGVTELGLHFNRSEFRLSPGDALDIYNNAGELIRTITASAFDGGLPPIFVDPDDVQGGVVGELLADPNLPPDLDAQYGWLLIPGDTARIVLRGDGQPNNGYTGFLIDRVAYFDNAFLDNSERELLPADTDSYQQRRTGSVKSFGEVRR